MIPEEQTWPPPPDTPEPLTEHDHLLTTFVCVPITKPPLSRLRLVRDLRKETGLQLRQCLAFVNSYCDRNAILLPISGPVAWVGCLPSLVQFVAIIAFEVFLFLPNRSHDTTLTRAARLTIRAERMELDFVFLAFFVLGACFNLIFVLRRAKQARRDAEYARDKIANRDTSGHK